MPTDYETLFFFFFKKKGSSFLLPKLPACLPACPQLHTKLVGNLNKLKGKGPDFHQLANQREKKRASGARRVVRGANCCFVFPRRREL